MSLTATKLDQKSRIGVDSMMHTNPQDARQMNISEYMWNYIRVLRIEAQRIILKVVKEHGGRNTVRSGEVQHDD